MLGGLCRSIACALFEYDDVRKSIGHLKGDAAIFGAAFGGRVAGDRLGLPVPLGGQCARIQTFADQVCLYRFGAPLRQSQIIGISPD